MNRAQHLAIDLGTYNSAAAICDKSGAVLSVEAAGHGDDRSPAAEQIKPFPSLVAYHPDGTVRAVGHEAKTLAVTDPERVIWGVKRLLGKTYKEALDHGELERMLIPVEPDDETGRCMFVFDGEDIHPEDVCAEILRHIRSTAEKQVGATLRDAVVSVPAYFDAIAINATVDAAKRAGFRRIDTIPEPVAAALALDLQVTARPLNFLVFDIGAGTLDVTAAEVYRSRPGPAGLQCHCLKNTGDTHLGGLDMDDRLVEWLADRMGLSALADQDRLRLRQAAEAARIALTTCSDVAVECRVRGEGHSYRLDRLELEESLRSEPRDLLEACAEQTRAAITGADWRPEEVERLLLVGGPAAMPCVLEMLSRVFRGNPGVLRQLQESDVAPEGQVRTGSADRMLAVSLGAAKSKGARIVKSHPYGYGIVQCRVEPVPGEPMLRVHREPCILVRRDSVFPSDPAIIILETTFYRLDHVFSLEVLQHVPDAEQSMPGLGQRPYRFLGEFQLTFRRVPFVMQVSMCLNEIGELETTIQNLRGPESATYVGLGSMRRMPIELPTSKLEARDAYGQQEERAPDPEAMDRFRSCSEAFHRFLVARCRERPHVDSHVAEGLEQVGVFLRQRGTDIASDVGQIYTSVDPLLHRAKEVKLLVESEYYRFKDELDAAWKQCWQ